MSQSQEFYLGLDLGRARCGLAIALAGSTLALPLAVIPTEPQATLVLRTRAALAHRMLAALVVGLPLDQHGKEGHAAAWARELGGRLAAELGAPVHFVDERYSTREAYAVRKQAGVKARRNRASVDSAAATVILQTFIDSRIHDASVIPGDNETNSQ
jgi:putative holliday junction resolvase